MGLIEAMLKIGEVLKLPPPARDGDTLWYFSYGSNMKSEVFCQRRGIVAQATVRCKVPGYVLSYAYDGIPFVEPAFATCVKREHATHQTERPDVHGVAFRISEAEFRRVLATEGGEGYHDGSVRGYRVSTVRAIDYDGAELEVRTLTSLPGDSRGIQSARNCPSQRYQGLVVSGAREVGLDTEYVAWLEGQRIYSTDGFGWRQKFARIAMLLLLGLPMLLRFKVFNPLAMRVTGSWRPPFLLVKSGQLHAKLVGLLVVPLLALFAGSGYCNGDDASKSTKKSE